MFLLGIGYVKNHVIHVNAVQLANSMAACIFFSVLLNVNNVHIIHKNAFQQISLDSLCVE